MLPTRAGLLRWHPDGRQLAVGDRIWDTITGQQTFVVALDRSEVQSFPVVASDAMDLSSTGVLAQGLFAQGRLQLDPNANPLHILTTMVTVPALPPAP
jgi:hypothetical protein